MSLHGDELIPAASEPYLLRMGETGTVFSVRIRILEMVVTVMEVRARHPVSQLASGKRDTLR